jgi:hypothetical protein
MNAKHDDFIMVDDSKVTIASIDAYLQADEDSRGWSVWFADSWMFERVDDGYNDVEYEAFMYCLRNDTLKGRSTGRTLLEAYHNVINSPTSPPANTDCTAINPSDEIASLQDTIRKQRQQLEQVDAVFDTMMDKQ